MRAARRLAGLVLRPLVSAALLAALVAKLGAGEVWRTLRGADPTWLAAGAGLVVLALAISAWKWQLLLAAQGLRVPLRSLFASYLVGLFFNNFLPSNIGGDVARVHDVARRTGQAAAAAASVIGERLLAGLALAATAALALPFGLGVADAAGSTAISGRVAASVLAILAVFGGLVALGASAAVRRRLGMALPSGRLGRLAVLRRVAGHVGDAFGDRRALGRVLALSFVFQATVVLLAWVAFLAIGTPVSLRVCFLFIPIISAIQLLPVSLNGLGVREGAYVLFFGSVGVSAPAALAGSLLFALLVAAVSLAGGVLFAVRR